MGCRLMGSMHARELQGNLEILVDYADEPTVTLRGEVDYRNRDRVAKVLNSPAGSGRASIRLDVRELVFMDSAGMSALIDAARAIPEDGKVTLIAASAQLKKIIDRSGLGSVFNHEANGRNEVLTASPVSRGRPPQVVEFEVPSRPEMMSHVRARVAEYASALPFSRDDVEDIKLAVGEASTNAIRHGDNPACNHFTVRMEHGTTSMRVFVCDKGCGFDPDLIGPPDDDDLSASGRGILFMRALMDEVRFHFGSPGTSVELVKHFNPLLVEHSDTN